MGDWWEEEEGGEGKEGKRSMNGKTSGEGRWLIDKLEEVGWFILNGCGKRDGEGA